MANPNVLRLAPRAGLLQKVDPRAKVLAAVLLILTASLLPLGSWFHYGGLYLLILLVALASAVSLGWIWRRSLVALPFLLAALALPFVLPGATLYRLPFLGWTVSQPGVIQGASLFIRSWIAVQVFLLLVAVTPIQELFWALESLGLPALLVSIIAFTYRYLFVLSSEAQRMMTARRSRQAGNGSGHLSLAERIKSIGGFLGSLLLRGLERSERVYAAMVARGYDGTVKIIGSNYWRAKDSLVLLGTFAFCAALLLSTLLLG